MKNLFLILASALCIAGTAAAQDDIKTISFEVSGNCGTCEERIEDAAHLKGVKRADWNKETKTIEVIYRSSKVSETEIMQSIADAGHDAGIIKAKEEVYEKLPKCCHYKSETCEH